MHGYLLLVMITARLLHVQIEKL